MFEDAPLSEVGVRSYINAKLNQITKRYSLGKNFQELEDEEKRLQAQSFLYDELYRDLDALDTKAGGLCSANAITFGLLTILLERLPEAQTPTLLKLTYVLSSLALVLSISVLFVRWSKTSNVERRSLEEMVEAICFVRNRRTIRYRLAIYASVISASVVCLYSADSRVLPGLSQYISSFSAR